jgi:hypothetical protein
MTGVRRTHLARPLAPVERQGVSPEIVEPERPIEPLAQLRRLAQQRPRTVLEAEQRGQPCALPPGFEHVSLHLAEGDRAFGERAVLVAHRIAGVLPALVHQAGGIAAGVFDEAVAVDVAVVVDPAERAVDVVPQSGDEVAVARTAVVVAGQDHEQRRRVHTAVVAAEWHLAEAGHLPRARFVQDLSRLGILGRVGRDRLGGSEIGERAAREIRVRPQPLERRDDAVAAERRAEPRHAGKHV